MSVEVNVEVSVDTGEELTTEITEPTEKLLNAFYFSITSPSFLLLGLGSYSRRLGLK